MFQAVAFTIYFNLVLRDQHAGIFCEVDATLVAMASVRLDVGAGGTLVAKGRMAAAAEYIRITCFDTALGTLHSAFILATGNYSGPFCRATRS